MLENTRRWSLNGQNAMQAWSLLLIPLLPLFLLLFLLVPLLLSLTFQIFRVWVCVCRELSIEEGEVQDFSSCFLFFFSQRLTILLSKLTLPLSNLVFWPRMLGGGGGFDFILFPYLVVLLQSPRHNKCTSPPNHYSCPSHHFLPPTKSKVKTFSLLFSPNLAGHFEGSLASLRSQPSFSRKLSSMLTKWSHLS